MAGTVAGSMAGTMAGTSKAGKLRRRKRHGAEQAWSVKIGSFGRSE